MFKFQNTGGELVSCTHSRTLRAPAVVVEGVLNVTAGFLSALAGPDAFRRAV